MLINVKIQIKHDLSYLLRITVTNDWNFTENNKKKKVLECKIGPCAISTSLPTLLAALVYAENLWNRCLHKCETIFFFLLSTNCESGQGFICVSKASLFV